MPFVAPPLHMTIHAGTPAPMGASHHLTLARTGEDKEHLRDFRQVLIQSGALEPDGGLA